MFYVNRSHLADFVQLSADNGLELSLKPSADGLSYRVESPTEQRAFELARVTNAIPTDHRWPGDTGTLNEVH